MRRALAMVACCIGIAGCAPEQQVTTANLHLRQLPSCALGTPERPRLTIEGDFPSIEDDLDGEAPFSKGGLPIDARFIGVEVALRGVRAGGLRAQFGEDQRGDLLVLPIDRSCPLGDPLAAAYPRSAVTALADGSLLIAGGELEDGQATASAVRLAPSATFASSVEGGMLQRRAGASATAYPLGAVIAGGAALAGDHAHETFEVYELEAGRFVATYRLADRSRRDHAAVALADGRVLLAGGERILGAEALDTAELLDPTAGTARLTRGKLLDARVHGDALVLDDGTVLVALGVDGTDPLDTIERYDPQTETFALAATVLPPRGQRRAVLRERAVVALEGRRILYVGCLPDGTCEAQVLLPQGEEFVPKRVAVLGLDSFALCGDTPCLRLTALRDGRVLVTGRAAAGGEARVLILDLERGEAKAQDATRTPDHVVALDDGSYVELDAFGASLRRHEIESPWHDAPDPVIKGNVGRVALDLRIEPEDDPASDEPVCDESEGDEPALGPVRWDATRAGLRALHAGRFDLPALRFAGLRIELALQGQATLLLEPELAPAIEIAIEQKRVRIGKCELARKAGEALAIQRKDAQITLLAGSREQRCDAPALRDAQVGVAFEASECTLFELLRVLR